MNEDLEQIARSYARLSNDIGGRMSFAFDIESDIALATAEREKTHLDQAFFVLCLAALEKQITSLANAREPDDDRRGGMREAKFHKRFQTAIKVAREALGSAPEWAAKSTTIESWYRIRNDIAHGDSPSQLVDIPTILNQADAITTTLSEVRKALP